MTLVNPLSSEPSGSIEATINYVSSDDQFVPREPLFSYVYSPQPEGRPQTNERYAPERVQVHDLRAHPDLTIETAGFQIVDAPTSLQESDLAENFSSNVDIFDPTQIDNPALKQYHAEIEQVFRGVFPNVIGVITYNQRTRRHQPKAGMAEYDFTSVKNYPLLRPHIDLVPESAAKLIEQYVGGAGRVLIVRGTVLDAPLAVADARTVNKPSKVHIRLLYEDGHEKGMFMIRNEGDIQWYRQSAQKPSEILLFKQYDSRYPEHVPAHSAIIDEKYDGAPGVEPRYSVESRSIILLRD